MTATTLQISSIPAHTAPRGAIWAAAGFAALLKWASAKMASIAAKRQRAAEMRAAREVLLLANSYQSSQPGLASDLRAAAMRMGQD